MLKTFAADLHIHTCLSPCADLDMTPSAIIKAAAEKNIDILAVTDHNSAENIPASLKAAENTDITVIAGMEITSAEEAHILALFDDLDGLTQVQDIIYEHLLPGKNDEEKFGQQVIVNEKDEVLGLNRRLLIGATTLETDAIVNTIHEHGGLAVASHVDKQTFSVLSQLGFIPPDILFDALEMSHHITRDTAKGLFGMYGNYTWISSSDAHRLVDIGQRVSLFSLHEPTLKEMSLALRSLVGRKVEWE